MCLCHLSACRSIEAKNSSSSLTTNSSLSPVRHVLKASLQSRKSCRSLHSVLMKKSLKRKRSFLNFYFFVGN